MTVFNPSHLAKLPYRGPGTHIVNERAVILPPEATNAHLFGPHRELQMLRTAICLLWGTPEENDSKLSHWIMDDIVLAFSVK